MFCQSCGTTLNDGARFCPKCGSGMSSDATDPNIGRTLDGKYRIEGKLGSGGMGTVYRATRLLIGDTVALKVLKAETTADPRAVERFRREAQAAARLKHPNVVVIHDFGIASGNVVYLVMELADGESLRELLERSGQLTPAVASELMDQICSALEEAHQRNIVHRDLKPENILVRSTPSGYRVKVLDFGIAKLRDTAAGSGTLTQVGTVMGTPYYMSPEQCMGSEVDARADIYSLGVILYEMLTGTVPFNASTASALVVQQVNDAPPPPRRVNPSIPPAVEAVVLRALEKLREARPATAAALAQELAASVRGTAPAPPMPTVPVRAAQTEATRPAVQQAPPPQPTTFETPPTQPSPGYAQWAPQWAPPPSRGIPAVLKVLGALLLLVVGVGVGLAVMYAVQLQRKEQPPVANGNSGPVTPPATNTPVAPPVTNTPVTPPVTNTPVTPPPTSAKYGRITSTKVTVRDRPSIRGNPIALLGPSDRVELVESQENPSDKEGVLSREAQFQSEAGGGPTTLPAGRAVFVLNDAGTEFYVETTDQTRTIRGYVEKGAVRFTARKWFRVRMSDGTTGWVNSQFVSEE